MLKELPRSDAEGTPIRVVLSVLAPWGRDHLASEPDPGDAA
ncbi:MAG: hypothetical protein ACI9MB_004819, partial [Verrucomicrobiales bacterium]